MTRRELLSLGASAAGAYVMAPAIHLLGPDPYDVVILNGRVMDPESKTDRVLNVGIRNGRIATLTKREIKGRTVIDALGQVVAPGFIDPISHGQDLENDFLQARDGVTSKLQMEAGVPDVAAWYEANAYKRMLNYGAGTSHVQARIRALGDDVKAETKEATDAQIYQMAEFIDRGLKAGGLGVGFGLEYQPAAGRWEVLEMFRVAGRYRVSCHVHTRYGTLLEEQSNLTAIEEVFSAAMAAGAALHVVHVPSMALGNTPKALKLIESFQARGFDVTCDVYPYTAFGTGIASEVFAEGWQEKFGITYSDLEWAKTHERLTEETFAKYREEGGFVIAHAIPAEAVRAAVASKATMIGSDGGMKDGVGHPRSTGTFARVLGYYVREQKVLSLMAALEKCSLRAAKRFEKVCPDFKRKGRIKIGADADIVTFSAEKVIDKATFDKPAMPSEGIYNVLVNGRAVVLEGELQQDARPGKGLRRPVTKS
ncbi:MAG: amidohydrolase family protein [Armatimonadetes bacterium]|nr:amidohydrolase family protein [Armatimonadota bacterium]